eukprot:FR737925.1.p1 GENE.FR737925.1~~FR737925.1.p1  ORF type:complete len:288 (+),score=-8.07 FR737925.1:145-1008(+)
MGSAAGPRREVSRHHKYLFDLLKHVLTRCPDTSPFSDMRKASTTDTRSFQRSEPLGAPSACPHPPRLLTCFFVRSTAATTPTPRNQSSVRCGKHTATSHRQQQTTGLRPRQPSKGPSTSPALKPGKRSITPRTAQHPGSASTQSPLPPLLRSPTQHQHQHRQKRRHHCQIYPTTYFSSLPKTRTNTYKYRQQSSTFSASKNDYLPSLRPRRRIWHILGLVIARINNDLGNQITELYRAPYQVSVIYPRSRWDLFYMLLWDCGAFTGSSIMPLLNAHPILKTPFHYPF